MLGHQDAYSSVGRCFGKGVLQGHVFFCGLKFVRNHLIRLCPKIMGER